MGVEGVPAGECGLGPGPGGAIVSEIITGSADARGVATATPGRRGVDRRTSRAAVRQGDQALGPLGPIRRPTPASQRIVNGR